MLMLNAGRITWEIKLVLFSQASSCTLMQVFLRLQLICLLLITVEGCGTILYHCFPSFLVFYFIES